MFNEDPQPSHGRCEYLGLARRQDSRQNTVDSKYLSRNVFARVACEQDRSALQIVMVADTTQWRTRR